MRYQRAVVCGVLLLLVACSRAEEPILGPVRSSSFGAAAALGERINVGFIPTVDKGSSVELLDLTITGLPSGLQFGKVSAARPKTGVAQVGVLRGELTDGSYELRPIEGLRLDKGQREWAIVLTVYADTHGKFVTRGIRLFFRQDGKDRSQELPISIDLTVNG